MCDHILLCGKNKGKFCQQRLVPSFLFCKRHLNYIKPRKDNNESFGITCELLLCELNNIPHNLENRKSTRQTDKLQHLLKQINLPLKKWIGFKNNSIDFICYDNTSLSVKSTLSRNNKVCPQKIGQPTRKRFIKIFQKYDTIEDTDESIKQFIFFNVRFLIQDYFKHLFCCERILWIWQKRELNKFDYILLKQLEFNFEHSKISFKHNNQSWNNKRSNQVYYKNKTIGEFQLHKNRSCVKFRFYMYNLLELIKNKN